jgi:hypothetical protein
MKLKKITNIKNLIEPCTKVGEQNPFGWRKSFCVIHDKLDHSKTTVPRLEVKKRWLEG